VLVFSVLVFPAPGGGDGPTRARGIHHTTKDGTTMDLLTPDRIRELLAPSSIQFGARASDRSEAVRQAGAALVATGAVGEPYIDAMLEREESVSTYVGEGIAMPHGTLTAKNDVRVDALVLLQFPDGIDWNGENVTVVIGIAAHGRHYISLISQLAGLLLDPERADALRAAGTPDEVYALFG
jgi:PTS system mannitol-specific IIA component